MTTPVALVGLGAVTGYGWGVEPLWKGVCEQRSAGSEQEVDGRCALVSIIPACDGIDEQYPAARTRMEASVFAAATEAMSVARERGLPADARFGLVFSTGVGDIQLIRDGYFRDQRPLPSMFPHVLPTTVPSLLAKEFGINGPTLVANAACASATVGAVLASGWMASGLVDAVLVVSADFSVIAEVLDGFRLLKVLIDAGDPFDVCRPFQTGSRGFFLGEAAFAYVLTSVHVADARAVVRGGSFNHDAFHLTATDPDGVQLARCMTDAMTAAGTSPDAVAYVAAHGSGTKVNDRTEANVVDAVFPDETRLWATKPLTGHCMTASSGAQIALATLAIEHGVVPAGPIVSEPHPRLVGGTEPRREGAIAVSSVGLGGFNGVTIIDAPGGGAAR